MANLADIIRDSALGRAMFAGRYGDTAQQPAVLAAQHAADVGYPQPDASNDLGEAQRYFAARQFVLNHPTIGAPVATAANRLHEGVLAWLPGLGEGGTNVKRIDAGDRGVQEALSMLAQQQEAIKRQTAPQNIAGILASAGARE